MDFAKRLNSQLLAVVVPDYVDIVMNGIEVDSETEKEIRFDMMY